MKLIVLLVVILPAALTLPVTLLNLTPEEAQKIIASQNLNIRFAPKTLTLPLPAPVLEKSADGSLPRGTRYRNGLPIENYEDYLEETYEASQFHGQDGLGRVMFGYSVPDIARIEARNSDGEVRGSYAYLDPFNRVVKVQYWADDEGFHHVDNLPKYVPEPVTDTPEVQAARLEHERAWKEAAALAGVEEDPNSDLYNRNALNYDAQQSQIDYEVAYNQPDAKDNARYPKLPYSEHIQPEGAHSEQDSVVINNANYKSKTGDDEEEKYEPRGFFYSFEYPVPVIVENPAKVKSAVEEKEELPKHEPQFRSIEDSEITLPNPEELRAAEAELRTAASSSVETVVKAGQPFIRSTGDGPNARISAQASDLGGIPIAAVHDAQVPTNLRSQTSNSQTLPVILHD